MLAVAMRNAPLAKQMRKLLIWNAPHGLYGSYVLSTFKTPQALHNFLLPYMNADRNDITPLFCKHMNFILASAIRMRGSDFLNDPPFLLKCAAIVDRMGNKPLHEKLVGLAKKIIKTDSPYHKLMGVCFDSSLDTLARIQAIEETLPADPVSIYLQMVYMTALTAEQQASGSILEIRSRHRIGQHRFTEALPILDQLLTVDDQSQYRFWAGWCQATGGNTAEAQATLKAIKHAPWRGPAQRLVKQLRQLPTHLAEHGEVFMAMLEDLRTDLDGFEMLVQGELPDGLPFDLYVAVGPDQSVYLHLTENGRVKVSYRSNAKTTKVFLDRHARQYATQGAIPIPRINIVQDAKTGRFFFQFGISAQPYDQLKPAITAALNSPWLTTPDGLSQWLVGMIQKGSFPAAIEQTPQGMRLKWITPQLDQPQFDQRQFIVDESGKLLSMVGSGMSITRLQYGPVKTLTLDPPNMPRASYVKADDANDTLRMAAFNRILKTVTAAMQ